MMKTADAIAMSAAGTSVVSLSNGYITLAIIGAIIGLISWLHGYAHSDPKWSFDIAITEAAKFILFGLLIMPAVVEGSTEYLSKYNLAVPSVRIMLGGISAFIITELIAIGLKKLSNMAGKDS